MYCSNCGTPVTNGVSFCNRCGKGLRERTESKSTYAITAFLTAITSIGIVGLGIMLGGSLVLRKEAGLPVELVGFFMLFTFVIVALIEIMLVRNLSKLMGSAERTQYLPTATQPPLELRPPTTTDFVEPIGSVTDNTTRTLEYARRDR
ncbi:MAG TPA: zinc ribbon domain-containing protein [Pyrinomonadaceae bacterium]|jgi:predicted nucleic acid-binding Zn ribbon protein|nr:zinc ribbon domain-containing protein [Pyrinomonadaceae bacterium]